MLCGADAIEGETTTVDTYRSSGAWIHRVSHWSGDSWLEALWRIAKVGRARTYYHPRD
jgi:hypothetical protein